MKSKAFIDIRIAKSLNENVKIDEIVVEHV
jgi:hypothetical protein